MKCDRCQGVMCEEPVALEGERVKIKNMKAWHCFSCRRTVYLSTSPMSDSCDVRRITNKTLARKVQNKFS
jgi:hypothetical protein